MAKARGSREAASIKFWLLALLVMLLPGVNLIAALVWAFVGENESRKNYFRAWLLLFIVGAAILSLLISIGTVPALIEAGRAWLVASGKG